VYLHDEEGHHVGQQYLPSALLGTYFYKPSEEGYEAEVKDRLARGAAQSAGHRKGRRAARPPRG
jgi:putative ATPase